MKRLLVLAVLTSAAALAASRAETTTYVDGNLTGVSPNTGGTLLFPDENAMYFRTGLSNVAVPYSGISKVELGAVKETSHDVPLYKVWAIHKRFNGGNKTETQLLILAFKNDEGEDKTMTLELAEPAVANVLAAIDNRTGKTWVEKTQVASSKSSGKKKPAKEGAEAKTAPEEKPADGWWGDSVWKTTRNADKWNKNGNPQ